MRRAFFVFAFLPFVSFADFDANDKSHLGFIFQDCNSMASYVSEIYSSSHGSFVELGYVNSNLIDIHSQCTSIITYFNSLNTFLSASLSDIENSLSGLATDSTLQSVLSAVQSIDTSGLASEDTLSSIFELLDFMAGSSETLFGYLETISSDLVDPVNRNLASIDSKIDDLATEETLQNVAGSLSDISSTLDDVLSAIRSDSSDDSSDDSDDWKTWRDNFWGSTHSWSVPLNTYTLYGFSHSGSSFNPSENPTSKQIGKYTATSLPDLINKGFERLICSIVYSSGNSYYTAKSFHHLFDYTKWVDDDFNHEYASIGYSSNSVSQEVSLEYSNLDFFSASLRLLNDGNKINGAVTMFLKHINDKMPKVHDTSSDENRITGQIDEASGNLDSLKQTFDDFSEIAFKEDVEDYFDSSVVLKNFQDVDLPAVINITIPSFGNFGAQVLSIQTYNLEGFLTVSRSVFACLYFVILAGFILFAFKLFVPVLSKFSSLLATVLNW